MKNSIPFLSLHVIQYAQVNKTLIFSDTANDTNLVIRTAAEVQCACDFMTQVNQVFKLKARDDKIYTCFV